MWTSSLSCYCNPRHGLLLALTLLYLLQQVRCLASGRRKQFNQNIHNLKLDDVNTVDSDPHLRAKRATGNIGWFFDHVANRNRPMIDVVFALERSTRATKHNFYVTQKKFVRSLIRDFLYVKPNATHVAVLTFGRDIDVVFNSIWLNEPHQSYQEIHKCDLVEDERLWSKVRYIDDAASSGGSNITAVTITARDILLQGRFKRPRARSVFMLLTAADYTADEYEQSKIGDIGWIDVFGVGVVNGYREEKLARIASSRYSVHAKLTEWVDLIVSDKRRTQHIVVNSPSEWVAYDSDVCPCADRSRCFCDVVTGFTRCMCNGGFEERGIPCKAPCSAAACSVQLGHICRDSSSGLSHVCSCNPAITVCGTIIEDCPPDACQNNGVCIDGINTYACACPLGKTGRHCNIEENECEDSVCPEYARCVDGPNSYFCDGVTTTAKPNPFSRNTVTGQRSSRDPTIDIVTRALPGGQGFVAGLSDTERLLLIMVPPVAMAVIAITAGLAAIVYILRERDRRRGNMSGITDTTSVISRNPSLLTFDSKCYTDEGTPRAPKTKDRTSYANCEDDILYGNEAPQRGMEEWYAYVLELFHNQGLNRVIIVRLDGEKWVLSPGSRLYMSEIEAAYNVLSHKMAAGKLLIQGREFGVVSNEDFVIVAHSVSNKRKPQEIACSTKTRQFVITGTADFSSDKGRCRRKIVELRDHIKKQGL